MLVKIIFLKSFSYMNLKIVVTVALSGGTVELQKRYELLRRNTHRAKRERDEKSNKEKNFFLEQKNISFCFRLPQLTKLDCNMLAIIRGSSKAIIDKSKILEDSSTTVTNTLISSTPNFCLHSSEMAYLPNSVSALALP